MRSLLALPDLAAELHFVLLLSAAEDFGRLQLDVALLGS
jgi:hypothetical protein